MQGGFQQRKWITSFNNLPKHVSEISCPVKLILKAMSKIFWGVEWNVSQYKFIFTFSNIIETAERHYPSQKKCFKNIRYICRSFRANMSISFTSETFIQGSMYFGW